ncbi:MAG: class I SAM-dependent methyltransferase [Candidatus Omnitrophota bacterium]
MFNGQREFYEKFHHSLKRSKLEALKQSLRLKAIADLANVSCRPGARGLIAGCGSGEDTLVVKHRVTAFDFSFNAIRNAIRNFPGNAYLVADGMELPFLDNSFDLIICSEVLEHIISRERMIAELHRVLKKDGFIVFSVPNWICWYGIARKTAEFILRRPVTAGNQPVDNWYTFEGLQRELGPYFRITHIRGAWYYPPFAKGYHKWLDLLIFPVFRIFQPLDFFLGNTFPSLGSHILAVRCTKHKKGRENG